MKYDLSIIIPSRNEMFLSKTIEDILDKKRGKTQVIAVLDGGWADPVIKDHPDVVLIHYSEPIGQRAACNRAASLSEAKYIAKCDAHCGFDEGFDVKLMADMKDDWTIVPVMRNLHAFDWVCTKCGWRTYQGRTPIKCGWKKDRIKDWHKIGGCDAEGTLVRDFKWIGKNNPQSDSYTFDTEPHFQYFREYRKRQEYKDDLKTGLTQSMSLQGSFFMLTREKYWELNICDERFGSWGSQGIEVGVKTWLSGGKVMVSHKTWYAHMFRSQGGDFGFPYPQKDRKVKENRNLAKDYFFNNRFDKAVHPLSWLIKKFWPVPGWTEDDILKVSKQNLK